MRKFNYLLSTLILFVFTNEISAQLYVKTGSFIYNKDSSVFVKGALELNGTGNFYLRKEGQLLQGTILTSTNTGTGKLSLFQEGTVHNFAYNYWCSPVGLATNLTTGNEPFGITLLNRPTTNINATAITTTGSYNGTTSNSSLNIASYWIFKYPTPSTSYTAWVQSAAASDIAAGQGFTMKGTSGTDSTTIVDEIQATNNPGSKQRYDFRGKPNDGNINIVVEGDKYTLTGNPYPSALDLNKFFDDNPNLDGKAYFWVQDPSVMSHNLTSYSGGYATYNFASMTLPSIGYIYTVNPFLNYDLGGNPISLPIPPAGSPSIAGRFAPIGQGFMVMGATGVAANSTATFKNAHRAFVKEGTTSVFQKSGNSTTSEPTDYGFYGEILNVAGTDYTTISKAPPPHIKINSTLNGSAIRQVAIGFKPGSIDGVDRADAKSPNSESNLSIDMYLVLDNTEYIHSITTFDINKRFPIGFKNNSSGLATFKIQVSDMINFTGSEKVYLYDGLTGFYYSIRENYHELSLSPGVYNNRFEITFKNATLNVDENLSNNFVIVQNNPNQLLSISNPNALDMKSVTLFDILGKQIFAKVNLGTDTTYDFPTNNLSDGVYVVQLQTTDNKSLAQKIIVKGNN